MSADMQNHVSREVSTTLYTIMGSPFLYLPHFSQLYYIVHPTRWEVHSTSN